MWTSSGSWAVAAGGALFLYGSGVILGTLCVPFVDAVRLIAAGIA